MSQTPRICPQCHAEAAPGQRFCPSCGAAIPDTGAPLPPTALANDSGGYSPTMPAAEPNNAAQGYSAPPPPPVSNPAYPSYSSGASYSSEPYSPPTDPYSNVSANYANVSSNYPSGSSNYQVGASGLQNNAPNPYQSQSYGLTPPQKKAPWLYIGIGIAVLIIIVGAIAAFSPHGGGTTNTGGNNNSGNGNNNNNTTTNATSANLSNLTFVYASDQITVTSVQQASKFSDDSQTTYDESPNYVRVNINEKQIAQGDSADSSFIYSDAFHLLLPNGSNVAAQSSQQDLGPDQGVVRTNWIDFPASANVDLSKLTMRVGTSSEQQMNIPLQSNADLSKYTPKTITPGTQFTYATMNWTIVSITKTLSMSGNQAKSGTNYISIDLKANNNTNNSLYLTVDGGFTRLKSDSSVISPDFDTTNTDAFDIVNPGTQNLQGVVTFIEPVSSTGQYTLVFLASGPDSELKFSQETITFQI